MSAAGLREEIDSAPQGAGVYIFKDEHGKVLYVGKAKNLRARVRSYLHPARDGRPAARFLLERAHSLEVIVTATEQEALLLEDTLIKKFKPAHNVRLKDDKSFLLVKLDRRTSFPRFVPVRRHGRRDPRATYFGPYASSGALRRTLRLLHEVVPLRDCSDAVLRNRSRPCLKYEIGRCSAPCVGRVSEEQYGVWVERAVAILRGHTTEVEAYLGERMERAAATLNFEAAARLRDQINSLRRTVEQQHVSTDRGLERDAVGLHREGARAALAVLRFRTGGLQATRSQVLESDLPDAELVAAFLTRLYSADAQIPREVLVPCEPHDSEMIRAWLAARRGARVALRVPRRGDPRRHVELAQGNAAQAFRADPGGEEAAQNALARLAQRLGLEELPTVMDCFDVSAFQGGAMVAARVRFRDGLPERGAYRRFRIRSHAGQDDFASLREVVERSLRRDLERADLPVLVVIDGGKGQLSAACEARSRVGLEEVLFAAMAKARPSGNARARASEERVFLEGARSPIELPRASPERHLLERLRDEAHRFAITYHRKVRSRLRSRLEDVPGVGPATARALLSRFGSSARVAAAQPEEIAATPRVTLDLARAILAHLRGP